MPRCGPRRWRHVVPSDRKSHRSARASAVPRARSRPAFACRLRTLSTSVAGSSASGPSFTPGASPPPRVLSPSGRRAASCRVALHGAGSRVVVPAFGSRRGRRPCGAPSAAASPPRFSPTPGPRIVPAASRSRRDSLRHSRAHPSRVSLRFDARRASLRRVPALRPGVSGGSPRAARARSLLAGSVSPACLPLRGCMFRRVPSRVGAYSRSSCRLPRPACYSWRRSIRLARTPMTEGPPMTVSPGPSLSLSPSSSSLPGRGARRARRRGRQDRPRRPALRPLGAAGSAQEDGRGDGHRGDQQPGRHQGPRRRQDRAARGRRRRQRGEGGERGPARAHPREDQRGHRRLAQLVHPRRHRGGGAAAGAVALALLRRQHHRARLQVHLPDLAGLLAAGRAGPRPRDRARQEDQPAASRRRPSSATTPPPPCSSSSRCARSSSRPRASSWSSTRCGRRRSPTRTPIVQKLRATQPDIVFYGATNFPDSIQVLQKVKEFGVKTHHPGRGRVARHPRVREDGRQGAARQHPDRGRRPSPQGPGRAGQEVRASAPASPS